MVISVVVPSFAVILMMIPSNTMRAPDPPNASQVLVLRRRGGAAETLVGEPPGALDDAGEMEAAAAAPDNLNSLSATESAERGRCSRSLESSFSMKSETSCG